MAKALSKTAIRKKEFKPDYAVMKQAAISLRAMNHKDRQKILELLDLKGELPVTTIYSKMRLEQSLTSAYLGLMRKANLVTVRKDGQQRFYAVNYGKILEIENSCKQICK